MTAAHISPSVLRWARERSQIDPDLLASMAKVNVGKLLLWEQGKTKPTFNQAQHLAKILHIPFGFLFLPNPPEETLPIPDLRSIGNHGTRQLSPDLHDLLLDILRKQDWYRDYLLEQGAEPLPFIGQFDPKLGVRVISDDLTKRLGLTITIREQARSWEDFLDLLMDKAEEAGVCMMRSGIVGSNTHRILDVQEFRGFAICDDIAPLVFINGKDAKAAQIFTLMHELAHLWIGQSGVSDLSLTQPADTPSRSVEKFCNAVAAETLVPHLILSERWNKRDSIDQNASRLAYFFHVSTVVIARRAFDLDLIKWSAFIDFYRRQEEQWRRQKKERGGNPYRNIPVRNGRRLTKAVVQSALSHNLLLRDAGKLLCANPSVIHRLAQEMSMG
jgi:Zn-dependent peptidase ImmA (M78 family)/transcriptional regulator with XRE-family HTH domain